MFRNKWLLLFFATLCSYGGSGSHTTFIQLPITINPLIQDAIQRDTFTDRIIQLHDTFFKNVTFSDIVKNLGHKSSVNVKKELAGLVVLGLAAQANGLTVEQFEFIQTSKWAIIMSVEELANVSNNITLPLNDKMPLIIIQEAMFRVLENKFNFKTEEIAHRLNTTKDEIYAFLEPGWIKVVNFITEKNILALSTNYTIPLSYIAEALNMSLSELYNSTLPQLEDILVNKIDIIKESSKMIGLVSSKSSYLLQEATSNMMETSNMMKTSSTRDITTTEKQTTRATEKPSTQHIMTTIEISPTETINKLSTQDMKTIEISPTSTIVFPTSASLMNVSAGQHDTKVVVSRHSYDTSKTTSLIDATENSSKAKKNSVIAGSIVMATSPYGQFTLKIQKSLEMSSSSAKNFSTFPHLKMATNHPSYVTTSNQFPKYPQASAAQANSLDFTLGPSSKTRKVLTNSKEQQFTNTTGNSTTSTENRNKPSSYYGTSLHEQAITKRTPQPDNTPKATSADDVDPVTLIVIPVICVLLVAAISFYICHVDKTQKTAKRRTKTAQPFWGKENGLEFFWGKENN